MNEFTVQERDGCVIVKGAVRLDLFPHILNMASKDAVMSPDLARMLSANFAFGLKEDVDALIGKLKPVADENILKIHAATLSTSACEWLASGERGMSSNAIFTHLTGINAGDDDNFSCHPHDPSDVNRCRKLLKRCPELVPLFPKMAELSKEWASLVRDWDLICKTIDEEKAEGRQYATRSYQLIKPAIGY